MRAWSLVFSALLAIACNQGRSSPEPVVLFWEDDLAHFPRDTALIAFTADYLMDAVGTNLVFLNWRENSVAILDTVKRAWYKQPFERFEKDMAELRDKQDDSIKAMSREIIESFPDFIQYDSCEEKMGPFRPTLDDLMKDKPIPYPKSLAVTRDGDGYIIKTTAGDSLGKIWLSPGKGLSDFPDYGKLKTIYWRFWRATEPVASHSAAGINIFAHPDVMDLYKQGLPAKAVVWGVGKCPIKDTHVWRPLHGTKPRPFPDKPPQGFKKSTLAETW